MQKPRENAIKLSIECRRTEEDGTVYEDENQSFYVLNALVPVRKNIHKLLLLVRPVLKRKFFLDTHSRFVPRDTTVYLGTFPSFEKAEEEALSDFRAGRVCRNYTITDVSSIGFNKETIVNFRSRGIAPMHAILPDHGRIRISCNE